MVGYSYIVNKGTTLLHIRITGGHTMAWTLRLNKAGWCEWRLRGAAKEGGLPDDTSVAGG
jgi:hypothetical protein